MNLILERDDVGFLIDALRCARGCIVGRSNLSEEEELRAEKYKYLYEKIIARDKQEMLMEAASNFLYRDKFDKEHFDAIYRQLLEQIPSTDEFWIRFRYIAVKKGYLDDRGGFNNDKMES